METLGTENKYGSLYRNDGNARARRRFRAAVKVNAVIKTRLYVRA